MRSTNPEIGRTYYRLTFADADMTMPGVEPLVYLGADIYAEHESEVVGKLYFQDPISLIISGPATEEEFNGEAQVFSVEPREVGVSVLSLEELVTQMQLAQGRAEALAYPVLKKASGTWCR